MDIFGIKKRRQAIYDENERRENERKKLIEGYLVPATEEYWELEGKAHQADKEQCALQNGVCPKCGGKNIVDKGISYTDYEPDYSYPFRRFIDKPVTKMKYINHCTDCEHEWDKSVTKYEEYHAKGNYYTYIPDPFDTYIYGLADDIIRFFGDTKWGIDNVWGLCELDVTTIPREVIEYLVYKNWASGVRYRGKDEELLGVKIIKDKYNKKFNGSEYLFTMPDAYWEMVQEELKRIVDKFKEEEKEDEESK